MNQRDWFSREEASSLIGKAIRTTVAFSGVPVGTVGKVKQFYKSGPGYHVDIAWSRFPGDHLVDGFSRTEFIDFLEMV